MEVREEPHARSNLDREALPDGPGELDEDVLAQGMTWLADGLPVAVATVVRTWGSAPRRAGSHMAMTTDGRFVGSVSGGCVENAVLHEAAEVLASGSPRLLEYGVADEDAWAVGLACGGIVVVYVEALAPGAPLLHDLLDARRAGRAVVCATDVETGRQTLLFPLEPEAAVPNEDWPMGEARRALLEDQALLVESGGTAEERNAGSIFLRPYNPPARLVVVGAVHIAQALARFAARVGFDVVVVDPRSAWASEERFEGVRLDLRWPGEALADLAPDHRTALVTLTHDPKLDDPALRAALATPAFYVGALGSRRTQAKRLDRLRAAGLDEATLARIHGPAGLDIGARTPAEIAVSILAEVLAALRRGEDEKG